MSRVVLSPSFERKIVIDYLNGAEDAFRVERSSRDRRDQQAVSRMQPYLLHPSDPRISVADDIIGARFAKLLRAWRLWWLSNAPRSETVFETIHS